MACKIALSILLVGILGSTSSVYGFECYECASITGIEESCLDPYSPKTSHAIPCNAARAEENQRTLPEKLNGPMKETLMKLIPKNTTSKSNTRANIPICMKVKGTQEGVSVVLRTCGLAAEGTKDQCENGEEDGVKGDVCICVGDKCNSGSFLTGTIATIATFLTVTLVGF